MDVDAQDRYWAFEGHGPNVVVVDDEEPVAREEVEVGVVDVEVDVIVEVVVDVVVEDEPVLTPEVVVPGTVVVVPPVTGAVVDVGAVVVVDALVDVVDAEAAGEDVVVAAAPCPAPVPVPVARTTMGRCSAWLALRTKSAVFCPGVPAGYAYCTMYS